MIAIRSMLPVLFLILLHNNIYSQEKPATSKFPDSLSLQTKDTDGDGVIDDEDKCANEPGPIDNFGCPVLTGPFGTICNFGDNYSFFFATGTSSLSPVSVKQLNKVVKLLKDDPALYVTISGYSDSTGNDDLNMKLSEARAKAVKNYLVLAGIDKDNIRCEGRGSFYSIDDNRTKAGRAKNRRVVVNLNKY